jgi:hypothetical protein
MNGREREALTMRHKEPDRVPVHSQLSVGHYNLNGGYKPHEIWYETEALADATVKLARRYRFDGILLVLPGRPENYCADHIASVQEGEDGESLTWRNGDKTYMPWSDNPHHYPADPSRPLVADLEVFDPDRDIEHIDDYLNFTWNTWYHLQDLPGKVDKGPLVPGSIPEYFFRLFDLVRSRTGDEFSIHGSVTSPLTSYFELFGYENALVGFITNKGKVHALLDRLTEHAIVWALALVKRGVDAVNLSSAFVAAPFVSREMYREFVIPYERRVNEAIKAVDGVVYTHTCGNIGDRLDLVIETGTMGLDTLDPPPLGDGDLAVAKRNCGSRLFFKGNLNPVALLNYVTEKEVIVEATEKIGIGKPGAGYILGTSCSVAPRVEPWKLELLTPLAEEIGRY